MGIEGAEFIHDSAETFSRPSQFDLVLHFGTLYHLMSPLLSLQKTFENPKPGGYLALEAQVYDHPDDENICCFMHMQNNDPLNSWALSTKVRSYSLELIGFSDVQEVFKTSLAILEKYMSRIILVARKPA